MNEYFSDSGSDDFNDFDSDMLADAESIMRQISPQKTIEKKQYIGTKRSVKGDITNKPKPPKALSKSEVKSLCTHLGDLKDRLIVDVKESVAAELFWDSMENGRDFIAMTVNKEQYKSIISIILDDYNNLYMNNCKGLKNTKYLNFQISWFQNTQKYISPTDDSISGLIDTLFDNITDSHMTLTFKSNLIAATHTSVGKLCSSAIISFLEPKNDSSDLETHTTSESITKEADADFMHFKIHGWVLKEIRDHTKLASCSLTPEEKLQWDKIVSLLIEDRMKDNLPHQLRYIERSTNEDKQFIYPNTLFLPFLRLTDVLFKEFTCEENITLYGKEVFSITKLQMNAHKTLKMNFDEASCQIGYLDTECYLYVKMYQLWIDKFCNVRTNDRLKSLELIEVADSNQISAKSQNLRDDLLADHVKFKSKKK